MPTGWRRQKPAGSERQPFACDPTSGRACQAARTCAEVLVTLIAACGQDMLDAATAQDLELTVG